MANPKRKHTRSRRDSRRANNWGLATPVAVNCPQCQSSRLPHHVCPACGYYGGELIAPPKTKKNSDEKK